MLACGENHLFACIYYDRLVALLDGDSSGLGPFEIDLETALVSRETPESSNNIPLRPRRW